MEMFLAGFVVGFLVTVVGFVLMNLRNAGEVDDLEARIRAAKPDYDALIRRLKEIKAELRKK